MTFSTDASAINTSVRSKMLTLPMFVGIGFVALFIAGMAGGIFPAVKLHLLMVLLVGFLMPRYAAMMTMAVYVVLSLVVGPTLGVGSMSIMGGYYVGFLVATVLIATMWHNRERGFLGRFFTALLLSVLGFGIITVFGTFGITLRTGGSWQLTDGFLDRPLATLVTLAIAVVTAVIFGNRTPLPKIKLKTAKAKQVEQAEEAA